MEVKRDEGINIGNNPFYQPTNSSYGQPYISSGGENPVKMGDIPLYNETVSLIYFILISVTFIGIKRPCFKKLTENLQT